jgi:hypothetical protein
MSEGGAASRPPLPYWPKRLGVVGTQPANPLDNCDPHVGPIGTLPRYYESGLVADGDPALGFGPRRGADGRFSWANGWRLYYASLAANFAAERSEASFKGFEAIAVSRLDSENDDAAKAGVNTAWKAPVIAWTEGPTPTDANPGPNEQVRVMWSRSSGATRSSASVAAMPGDRPDFPAIAISPDGGDAYLTYMSFLQPWQSTTAAPRLFQGVVRHADVNLATGALGAWSDIDRAPVGDALVDEFLGDYNYAFATNDAVLAVWNDARNGAACPAIDAYRQDVANGTAEGIATDPTRPAPAQDCPPTFGNTDIFGGSYADPTP